MDEPLDHDAVLSSPGSKNTVAVDIEARDQWWDGAARGHLGPTLRSMHRHWDDGIVLARTTAATLPDGRRVPVYQFSSAYWGRRLDLFIPEGKAVVRLELDTDLSLDEPARRRLLESVLASYRATPPTGAPP